MAPSRGPPQKYKAKGYQQRQQKPAKQPTAPAKPCTPSTITTNSVPIALQQAILTTFRNAYPSIFGSDLQSLLQEIKQYLYNRDFGHAFGKEELLEAYAVRWSPSRALGYVGIFREVFDLMDEEAPIEDDTKGIEALERGESAPTEGKIRTVVCLGGGAGAEAVALAGLMKFQENTNKLKVQAIDSAPWASALGALYTACTTAPPLSAYASASARAVNSTLVSLESFAMNFHQLDLLSEESEQELGGLITKADVITLMFTLNELYNSSLSSTQRLLQILTEKTKKGTILVVVDSPGSYAALGVGKEGSKKTYPMQFLLDFGLLGKDGKGGSDEEGKWEKLVTEESKWFRLPEGLKYPIELENMRFQMHVYRRL